MEDKGKSIVINNSDTICICLDDDDDTCSDLVASIKASFPLSSPPIIHIDDNDDDNSGLSSPSNKRRKCSLEDNLNPGLLGQLFLCGLCNESKPKYQSFNVQACLHCYCCGCMQNYVSSKLEDGATNISCPAPDCFGALDPEYCRDFLPKDIYQQWGLQLCESIIPVEQRLYCPFEDCSAMMINDRGGFVAMTECPNCNRLFCANCRKFWHEGPCC